MDEIQNIRPMREVALQGQKIRFLLLYVFLLLRLFEQNLIL